jgi:phosphate transport system substrate-binding protein
VSRKRIRFIALVCAVAMIVAVPATAEAKGKKIITISGSTSVYPLEAKLARKFIKTKKGKKFGFKILQGGSNVGVSDVAKGRVSIGASSRDPASGDPGGLVFTKIARDALCLITNNANPVGNLSKTQVKAIFVTGGQTWGQNGLPGTGGSIVPIGRAPTSGTHDAFRNIFLDGTNQGNFVQGKASNGLVQQGVQSNPDAVGYVSLAFTSGVHIVNYEGVECSLRNAISGTYGGVRNFWFVTRGTPTGGAKKFINWTTHSPQARNIVSSEWVPLS